MEEYEFNSQIGLVGRVVNKEIVNFQVWLNCYDLDIDIQITDRIDFKKLKELKGEFLKRRDQRIDAETISNRNYREINEEAAFSMALEGA